MTSSLGVWVLEKKLPQSRLGFSRTSHILIGRFPWQAAAARPLLWEVCGGGSLGSQCHLPEGVPQRPGVDHQCPFIQAACGQWWKQGPLYLLWIRERRTVQLWMNNSLFSFIFIFIYFLAVLYLCCCSWASFNCGEWGLLSSCGVRASHWGDFSCCGARALGVQASVLAALEFRLATLEHGLGSFA